MSAATMPEWNRTETEFPRESTIQAEFAKQVAATPEALALVAGAERLSYRQLDERSSRLAQSLSQAGVGPGKLAGISLERTADLVIGLLAILKSGAAYVPLDPAYPAERLAWIIEDSKMPVLLTSARNRAVADLKREQTIALHVEDLRNPAVNIEQRAAAAQAGDLAYVIYTSGSTGKPKGVMVQHRNVLNFFTGMDRAIGTERGVWLAVTSASFDISVLELLWTLCRGFAVVLHNEKAPATIAEEIEEFGVTHLQMTPSLARMLTLDSRSFVALGRLKQMLLGGEAVPASIVRSLREVFKGEMFNMYGPTETTIWSTTSRIVGTPDVVSIGRPIANTQIFLLDEQRNPVGAGETGELYIGGEGVAAGYWNQPTLTAERFVLIPSLSPMRIYRTGDLARIGLNGELEFLGRNDFQIKLRGHRIELGEIEAQLERLPEIRQAVVVAREDREGDKRLVAFVVAENGASGVEGGFLRKALEGGLPEYMMPSSFVTLSKLPLTENGKIDRKALLRLPLASETSTAPASAPTTEMERVIAKVWKEALGVENVSLNDNFFDLGAHSLIVAEVHSKLQNSLGRELSLVDLFQFPTVSALAAHLTVGSPNRAMSDRAQRRRMARQAS